MFFSIAALSAGSRTMLNVLHLGKIDRNTLCCLTICYRSYLLGGLSSLQSGLLLPFNTRIVFTNYGYYAFDVYCI